MLKIKTITIKLDNLSVQDIAKIQNEVENRISKTQFVTHTQATKRKRKDVCTESASKKRKVKLQIVAYICN